MRLRIAFLFLLAVASGARAEDLNTQDRGYLHDRFGLSESEAIYTNMDVEERARLHALINDPWTTGDYLPTRDALVQSALIGVYNRECGTWARVHVNPACPPATNPTVQPGKVVADKNCNMCHLFGTAEAPPFFALARSGALSRTHLTNALASGHRMSPISLTTEEVDALLIYIAGLK